MHFNCVSAKEGGGVKNITIFSIRAQICETLEMCLFDYQ